MAIHQTPSQRKTVKRVMHEYKHGELKTARGARKVKNPKQAIAIALSEAGASKYDTPKERSHNLRRTKAKEKRGETYQAATEGRARAARTLAEPSKSTTRSTRRASASKSTASKTGARKPAIKTTARRSVANGKTRTELYAEASRRQIAGRSKM